MEDDKEKKEAISSIHRGVIYQLPSCEIKEITVTNLNDLEGKQTLENSIFSPLRFNNNDKDKIFLCLFLEKAINIFNVSKYVFEGSICSSISSSMLVKTELKKLNQFFDTGEYENSKSYHSRLVIEGLYDVYTSRLYGYLPNLINTNHLNNLERQMHNIATYYYEDQEVIDHREEIKENLNYVVTPEYYLSISLQVLLWLRDYLEELKEAKDFKEIFSRRGTITPTEFWPSESTKKGFTIANPDKTIPALHKALITNGLIDDIKLDDFEDAFLNGNGLIQWHSKGTHGVGASNLGYFLKKMSSEKIIKSTHKIEVLRIAENIFKFKGGSTPIAQSLNNSATPNDYKLFDNVVKDLKNI